MKKLLNSVEEVKVAASNARTLEEVVEVLNGSTADVLKKVARELGFERVLYVNEKKASLVWQLQDEVLEEWGAAACEARAAKEAAKAAEDARKAAMTYPEKIELLNEAVAEDQDAAMIVLRRYFTIDEVRKVASLMGIYIETSDKRDLIDGVCIRPGMKSMKVSRSPREKQRRQAKRRSLRQKSRRERRNSRNS